jgi:thiol:disulfide interchange protein DsbD
MLFVLKLVVLALVVSSDAYAADDKHISFKVEAPATPAGDIAWVTITATTDKHWHTYSTKHIENQYGLGPVETTIELSKSTTAALGSIEGKLQLPTPKRKYDEGFEVTIETLEGTWQWKVPVRLKPTLTPGSMKGAFVIGYQLCDTTSCLPPDESEVPFTINVLAAVATGSDTTVVTDVAEVPAPVTEDAAVPPAPGSSEIEDLKRDGLLGFFFGAMGIGFLALLTPCVFPMIPITVSFFTKRNEQQRGKAVRDAFLYAIGIISTFTLIGIVFSVLFGATSVQDLAANPWLNLAIGVLFVTLAFNLFGAFEIQVPTAIMNRLNAKAQGTGVVAVLLMGLVFSLTSFTCTVPFVGTLLLTAASGDYLYPAVGTLGFATAFAIPFFFLALFPSLLAALPRAGGWMNNLKVVMGFLEIAAAVKFFSTAEFVWGLGVLPRDLFLAIWVGVFFLVVLYVLGLFEMKLDSRVEKVSGLRAFFAVIFASLTFYFFNGMMGKPLAADLEALLPPDNYEQLLGGVGAPLAPAGTQAGGQAGNQAGAGAIDHSSWLTSLDDAKAVAAETGKPIFIDFTGFACTNCRLMEKNMFPRPAINDRLEKMVLVQLFTDRKEEPYITNQNIMRQYGTVANPLYVILKPDGSYVGQSAFTRDEAAFASFLDSAFE